MSAKAITREQEARSVLLICRALDTRHVLTCTLYGAAHDLHPEILGTSEQESVVLQVKLNMIYNLDKEARRYTDLINIKCESDDVHASDEDSEQSIEHEANSKIVPTNSLQDVNEPCCSRELNKTPIAARQTVRANVIEMSPTDEKELKTVQSMYSDDIGMNKKRSCKSPLATAVGEQTKVFFSHNDPFAQFREVL
ncbi:hypothetical protein ILUMI_11005 [Ignelater luminosus]|uniref:Uncharacterized protein n=1 Tax=Ignelater luminosus TaxID=2038154 RepID=A0A8K0D2X0_IGNLU|nr:hypothetical protein ILUMI_11005 [Ignelater luminosus]